MSPEAYHRDALISSHFRTKQLLIDIDTAFLPTTFPSSNTFSTIRSRELYSTRRPRRRRVLTSYHRRRLPLNPEEEEEAADPTYMLSDNDSTDSDAEVATTKSNSAAKKPLKKSRQLSPNTPAVPAGDSQRSKNVSPHSDQDHPHLDQASDSDDSGDDSLIPPPEDSPAEEDPVEELLIDLEDRVREKKIKGSSASKVEELIELFTNHRDKMGSKTSSLQQMVKKLKQALQKEKASHKETQEQRDEILEKYQLELKMKIANRKRKLSIQQRHVLICHSCTQIIAYSYVFAHQQGASRDTPRWNWSNSKTSQL